MMRRLLLLFLPCHHCFNPTLEELEVALSQVKTRKAGDLSGIVPELICLEFLFCETGCLH